MEMNYKHLIKWIYHNPRVVNINRFCIEINYKPQNMHYYLDNKKPMPKEIVEKVKNVFSLSDEQIDKFFYLVKSYK